MHELTNRIAKKFERRVFLDIGACWGLHALTMWRTGQFDEVVAFEPDAVNISQLYAQFLLNGLVSGREIAVVNAGVSDHNGSLQMDPATERTSGNRGAARMVEGGLRNYVEGHEAKALAGMARTLCDRPFVMQVETDVESSYVNEFMVERIGAIEIGRVGRDVFFTNIREVCE